MIARRILLLISIFALVAFATPATSASAGTLTITQLRAQLRQTRHHLSSARLALASARTNLVDVSALLAAMDGASAVGGDLGANDPAPTTGDAPIGDAATPTPSPSPAPAPTAADSEVAAAIADMNPTLAERILADGVVSDDELAGLQARVVRWRGVVRRARRAEYSLKTRLAMRLQIREWNRQGAWRPLIEIAARRYKVNPDGLYRLMMSESGGRRYAGTTYKGLFQYYPGTWTASWNPWRSTSIYNGWAQIRATAYAISRGMGPGNWPASYPRAF